MARHRLSPMRVPFLARSRRPALLGGALGGGAALVIGLVTCAALSTTSVGVHFTFVDRAEAAVIGSIHHDPVVTRDLATAPSETPRPTPTASVAAHKVAAAAQAASSAVTPTAAATAIPTAPPAAAPVPTAAAATAAPAASPSSSPSAAPTSSASPTSSPAASPAPSPQPTNPITGDPVACALVIFCF
ncbi:hypothetical protein [Gryllotalpicola koreensis]